MCIGTFPQRDAATIRCLLQRLAEVDGTDILLVSFAGERLATCCNISPGFIYGRLGLLGKVWSEKCVYVLCNIWPCPGNRLFYNLSKQNVVFLMQSVFCKNKQELHYIATYFMDRLITFKRSRSICQHMSFAIHIP